MHEWGNRQKKEAHKIYYNIFYLHKFHCFYVMPVCIVYKYVGKKLTKGYAIMIISYSPTACVLMYINNTFESLPNANLLLKLS